MFANNSADNLLFDKSNTNLFDDTNSNLTSLNNVTVLPEPVSVKRSYI